MPRTGTSKDLFNSYRNGCGTSNMEMILLGTLSCILPTYVNYEKMHKLFLCSTVCTVLIDTSWRKETKHTILSCGSDFEEGNQEAKNAVTREVSKNFNSSFTK